MEVENHVNSISKGNSEKNGNIKYKIPILSIPQKEDALIIFMYNEDINSIESQLLDESSPIPKKYQINNFPVEKCKTCKCELSIDNFFFLDSNNNNIELFCSNCFQDKESINGLEKKNYKENSEIINKLNSYLETNKDSSSSQYIKLMEDIIIFAYYVVSLESFFKELKAFHHYSLYLKEFISSLTSYFEIVHEFKMENLFLFIKNFVVISSSKKENELFINFFKQYRNNLKIFNISSMQLMILNNIIKNNMKDDLLYLTSVEFQFEKEKNKIRNEMNKICDEFSSLKIKIGNKKISWLRKEIKIKELKNNIIKFLQDYNYSYNYISSKKVLERKFINGILFTLFKYHHDKFDKVKENDSLINSLQKELQNIIKFLENSENKIVAALKQKILYEYKYFEGKKKSNKSVKSKSTEKISKKDFSLTNGEKTLLKNYLISSSEDSYTTITTLKHDNPEIINPNKLQVIIEFLFFIRDKTVDIIHLLNDTVLVFFEFLNQCSARKKLEKENKIENEINEIIIESDESSNDDEEEIDINNDEYIDELKKEFNASFSKSHEKKNKEIFTSSKIQTNNEISLSSAFKYIFDGRPDNDFSNELNYLYENVILPKRKKNIEISKKEKEIKEKNYWNGLQERIERILLELEKKFKNDPMYDKIMAYLEEVAKAKKSDKLKDVPSDIEFYENHVDNFLELKEIFILSKEVKEYIKLYDQENDTLKTLKLIKEKYKYILSRLKKYLVQNCEDYEGYYNEWKTKNPNFVVKNYELKDLLQDLEKLVPKEEKIKISGRDRRNFNLILYLFQTDYFLKDYI